MAKKMKSYDEWMKEKYGVTNDYIERVNAIKEAEEEIIAPFASPEAKAKAEEEKRKKELANDPVYKQIKSVADLPVEEEEERTYFKESSGNLWQSIYGTLGDIGENLAKGFADAPEKLWDGLLTLGTMMNESSMMQAAQNEMIYNTISGNKEDAKTTLQRYTQAQEEAEKVTAEYVAKDIIDTSNIDFGVERYSVLGEKSDDLIQSGADLITRTAISAIPVVGVPLAYTYTGLSSMGSEAESAFKQGATFDEAFTSGVISAAAEIGTEQIFGGIKIGGKTFMEGVVNKLASKIPSKALGTLAKWGMNTAGEGTEELLSGVFSALGQQATYLDEKEFNEIYTSEAAWEEFIGGVVLGGLFEGVSIPISNKKGIDYVTGLSKNEKTVIDKVYNDAVAEKEKVKGKKLTTKEKTAIFDDIVEQAQKGYISTDTIEEVLGGDSYKAYKDVSDYTDGLSKRAEELGSKTRPTLAEQYEYSNLIKRLEESNTKKSEARARLDETMSPLLKNSNLIESYNEIARRGEAFKVDLSQYTGKQKEAYKRAMESGVLNNTNRSHELVDILSRIEADKGIVFDYANNAKLKESGFAVEGKTVNGFEKGGKVTLNVESSKAWQSTVGHEITHILEGTEAYGALQSALFKYAESKGELASRKAALAETYKDIKDADIDKELTADLVGDYLFSDKNFIRELTTDKNLFQKVYDEIKYLCKVATGKELTEIEKVKQEFDKAWKEMSVKGVDENAKTNRSVSEDVKKADAEYLSAVERGDVKTEERMVREAAREAGYPVKVYHGTSQFGFTKPNVKKSDDGISFFATEDIAVGSSYTGVVVSKERNINSNTEKLSKRAAPKLRNQIKVNALEFLHEYTDTLGYYDSWNMDSIEYITNRDFNEVITPNEVMQYATMAIDTIAAMHSNTMSGRKNSKQTPSQNVSEETKQKLTEITNKYTQKISELISPYQKSGMYGLYANTENFLVIDAQGGRWNDIKSDILPSKEGAWTTRDVAQYAKENGYKGVTFKNIVDPANHTATHPATVYAFFEPQSQVKSADPITYDNKGNIIPLSKRFNAKNKDIRFSLSEDSNGNELSLAVQKRFANSKAVDENGNLKVLYHGTANGEFYTFDKSKGSVEGDFGSGFYFTDSESDVENNYEGGGADFDNKVARRAEQIESEEDIDYHEAEARAREELYKGSNKHTVYLNIENPAVVGETTLFDYESYAEEYDREDYDSDEDYEGDVEQLIADDIDKIIWDIDRNIDIYSTDGIAEVLWNAVNEGGIDIEQLKANINNLYLEDNNGNLVGNEVTRQIIESLGYDGIIDPTVSSKFNMGLSEDTTHYIVFKPNQIKSIDNLNPTDDPDIRKSLSNEGEQFAPVGNYSTPANETYLAPTKEDVSTMETPAEATPTVEAVDEAPIIEDMYDDAPMPTDADAPPVVEYYNTPDTTPLDEKTLSNIGKSLRETLSLTPEETKAIQEIVQEYSTTETPNKADLYDKIKSEFGVKYWKERIEAVAEAKRLLRDTKVYVSDIIKSEIPNFARFRKSNAGKIKFSKDGNGVDTVYQYTLSPEYPLFFPADITNPTDQLLKMAEVANMPIYATNSMPLDDNTIIEAVEIITDEINRYKEGNAQKYAENASREHLKDIAPTVTERMENGTREIIGEDVRHRNVKTVDERLAEKIKDINQEIADNKSMRSKARTDFANEIERLTEEYLAKKDKNTQAANNIVRRILKLQDKQGNVDAAYSKRISDLEARATKMNTEQYSRAMHKQDKMQEDAKWAEDLLGDTSTWVDKKHGLQYSTNTERRNLRDIVRDENGNVDIAKADAIDDALNGQYNRETAAKNRELAKRRGKYAELKITKAEDAYIQMLGELRHNPETTLTEEAVNKYYEKHKNKIDKDKVDKVIELARQDYDNFLKRANEELRKQGMKELPYRQGYFPHFTEPKQNFIQKLLNWKTQDNEIPTSIAGLTETFRPSKSWQSFDKTRYSDETDYSFTKGFDTYSQGVLDWIYHLDTLQKRRAVENHIRFTHSDEGIKAKIKEVYANEEFDANEAQAQIEHILAEAKNPLNNFVQDFTTRTNILAGKKNSLDRAVEQSTNRHIYSVMTNVQNRMSANMVLANVRSALTNFIPITQSWAQVSPLRSLQATKDTIANAIKDDGTIEKSTFLTNRLREADNLYKTGWDKVLDKAGIMFEVVDNFSSQVIWRSKYIDNIKNGMTEAEAIRNADQFAENVMAGRSKGNEPTLFNAKNPLVKAFTMFQLEVNNQYGYLFKDVPNDLKAETNHWKLNLAKGYTTAFIGAYVYNALMEEISGSGAALDPIGIIEDLLRDLGLFDDDEEKEPDEVALNLVNNVVEELPFVGGYFGGGRIPISSALPYGGEYGGGLSGFVEDVSEGNWENVGKEMMNPILNVGLPVGGGQIKKTVQGLKMFNTDEEHPIAGSYTDSGDLRFPVDDTLGNRIQAGIFGQYANKNAREYFDNDYAPLKEKQIQEYMDADLPIADYWKYRDGLKGLKTNAEKADYINSLDIENWQKNLLMNNILDRKEDVDMSNYGDYGSFEEFDYAEKNPEKYKFFKDNGISYKDYESADEDGKRAYNWAYENPEGYTLSKVVTNDVVKYRSYVSDMYDIKADKDADGKSISGSRKEKVINYINNLDADYETKIILFKTEYPADDTYNADIINYINNRNDLTYEERVTIYTELGFRVKDGYVYAD
jgi:hypothetical protein